MRASAWSQVLLNTRHANKLTSDTESWREIQTWSDVKMSRSSTDAGFRCPILIQSHTHMCGPIMLYFSCPQHKSWRNQSSLESSHDNRLLVIIAPAVRTDQFIKCCKASPRFEYCWPSPSLNWQKPTRKISGSRGVSQCLTLNRLTCIITVSESIPTKHDKRHTCSFPASGKIGDF